jgi:hypothetical protein
MQRIRLLWAALAALVTASGCTTDSGGSMLIVQNQVVEGEACDVPASRMGSRNTGLIDTNAGDGYVFTPLVQSLIEDTSEDSERVISMRGADVEISFTSGFDEADVSDDRLIRFSSAFSGSVFPGAQSSFAFVVVQEDLLDEIAAAGGSAQLSVEVTVFGDLDGSDVESDPFVYPVEVCDGCLTIDRGPCAALGDDFEPRDTNPCNPAQDVAADCCTSDGGDLVCLAP